MAAVEIDGMLRRAVAGPRALARGEMAALLADRDAGVADALFAAAREVKAKCGKADVLPRGLIEVSNVCAKDCLYCGIRKSNDGPCRYRMTADEVGACVDEARRRGLPAVAFQAGEIEGEANTAFYEALLAKCRGLEVTLSLGEQTEEVYRRWKAAAGDSLLRYLIRIETSNRKLYEAIHPAACSFDRRLGCIRALKRLGYVTGSGVMIGLPGQTAEDLADDIVFFGREDLDMVGMGPFIPTAGTPMGEAVASCELGVASCKLEVESERPQHSTHNLQLPTFNSQPSTPNLQLALRMIALTRLYMHGINIVAATALDALDPAHGRERGIAAGANVVMPNLTPAKYVADYALYPGKR